MFRRISALGPAGLHAAAIPWAWVVAAALAAVPLVSESVYVLTLLIEVFVFAVVAISYDLLMGYAGIVTFGHALFFGTGAYVAGLLLARAGAPLLLVVPAVLSASALLGLLVAVLSLRVRGHYFAMVTLAFAELGHIVAIQWDEVTGGSDGLTGVRPPAWLNDKEALYFFCLAVAVGLYLLARRVVDSPAGRVLVAIRENEQRAESIGYDTFRYKLAAMVIAACYAGIAGMLFALFLNYVYPTLLGADVTIKVLLMTIIGGAGTLSGPAIGALVVSILGNVLSSLFERWLLVFGLIYVAIVMFFPRGVAGSLAAWREGAGARARAGAARDAAAARGGAEAR